MRNFIVTIDGKSYSVGVEEVGSAAETSVSPVINKVPSQQASKPEVSTVGEKILSPFPGIIKNILIADGAVVKKDQPVIVLEAMKMDNEITAPCDGKITFKAVKGANVETNAVLAVIG